MRKWTDKRDRDLTRADLGGTDWVGLGIFAVVMLVLGLWPQWETVFWWWMNYQ